MTTPLIEAIARGMCRVDGWCRSVEPCATCSGCDSTFFEAAQAALTAITEAGYICVPRKPTEAMLDAGQDSEDRECWSGPLSCWERMISAAQGDG